MIGNQSLRIFVLVLSLFFCSFRAQGDDPESGAGSLKMARVLVLHSLDSVDIGPEVSVEVGYWNFDEFRLPQFGKVLGEFEVPFHGKVISRYGIRRGRMHTGTDIKCYRGDTIYASYHGRVLRASRYYGYGNLVVLGHLHGMETYYAHLDAFLVSAGDSVVTGQPLGLGGRTGRATAEHLHFEVREGGKAYNPELIFDFENFKVRAEVTGKEALADFIMNPETGEHFHITSRGNAYVMEMSALPMVEYVIKAGDSLWKIARRFNTSVAMLCEHNNLTAHSVLRIGSVLKVFGTVK